MFGVFRKIDRYIMKELLGPLTLGFVVYTFIMLLRVLFRSTELIIARGAPADMVGRLLLTAVPNILVLTIPMALLFGILTAVSRLSSESELTAMRASGISLLTLYRPILLVSALLTLANTALMVYALPWGNTEFEKVQLDIVSQGISQQVQPRVFWDEWDNQVLYVSEIRPDDDRWYGVFMAEALPTSASKITFAEWGRLTIDEAGEEVRLKLVNATTHEVNLNQPERYRVNSNRELDLIVDDRFTSKRREERSYSRGVRSFDLAELRERIADPEAPIEMHRLARVEIHKRFSIPAACLVFGLIALPLGFNNQRGNRASGFALSIAVILVYYLVLNNGDRAARVGKLEPWLAMWLPNILLALLGLFLLWRRNRDKSLLLSKVDRWIRQDLWQGILRFATWREGKREGKRRRPRERQEPRVRLRIARPRLLFPNIMDRYTLRLLASVLTLVFLSILTLFIVADFSQKVEGIFKNGIGQDIVLRYYRYLSFQVAFELAPIVVLVSTLITFSLLARRNEITAAKALGMSLYRLSLPAVVAAGLVSASCAYLQSEVLPVTNQKAANLERRIANREPTSYRRADQQWLLGQEGYIYHFLHYDRRRVNLQRLQVFELDPDRFRLAERLFAADARYDPASESWLFENGWTRSFEDPQGIDYQRFTGTVRVDFPETPDYFESEIRPPEEMAYPELKAYIAELERSGQRAPELAVQLHKKLAFPATSLVMALVALPFAFRLGRQGALYGVGVSIVVGMAFFAVMAIFEALGEAGLLPPAVAVWSPGLLFATFSLYLLLGVRT